MIGIVVLLKVGKNYGVAKKTLKTLPLESSGVVPKSVIWGQGGFDVAVVLEASDLANGIAYLDQNFRGREPDLMLVDALIGVPILAGKKH